MCEIDWNLFNGAVAAGANLVMAMVAIAAAVFAYRQVREARHARLQTIALQVNSDVQNYVNSPRVRHIRRYLLDLLVCEPDPDKRVVILLNSVHISGIWEFMARMNNICWAIESLPTDGEKAIRDGILSTIASNLVAEWDCLEPLAAFRRKERKSQGLDDGTWYMKDFESMATYARKHFSDHTKRVFSP